MSTKKLQIIGNLGGNIELDTTLTQSGLAADAKAVGDALDNVLPITSAPVNDVDIWIDPDDNSVEDSHVNDKNNPHNVTAEQVGAALEKHAENHRFTDTLTWDGEIGDRETVTEESVDFDGVTLTYVRVWDEAVPLDNGFTADTTVSNLGLEEFYSLGYEHHLMNDQLSVVLETYGNEIVGGFQTFPTLWCVSSDNVEWADMVFPKAGVYFTIATSERGVVYHTKSLTVHNYDFGDVADPITPEMISAAPEHHAVASEKHGVATNELFGHTRLHSLGEMAFAGREEDGQDPMKYYTNSGVLIGWGEEVLKRAKGAAVSAGFFFVHNNILTVEFEDIDYLWDEVDNLHRRVIELENKVNALGG